MCEPVGGRCLTDVMAIPSDADPAGTQCDTPSALRRMREEAFGLADTLWAARGVDELMDTVAEVEALKSTLDAVLLGAVGELAAVGACGPAGWASARDYVTAVAGGHKGTGPAVVRLAAAVTEPVLRPVADAMREGWLSTAKAQVIERAVDALPHAADLRGRAVQVLLDEAKALDATDLKKLTHRLLEVVDPDGVERRDERALDRLERAAHHGRHLSVSADQVGGAWIKGRCSAEDAALIKATLMPLAAPTPTAGRACAPSTCAVRAAATTGATEGPRRQDARRAGRGLPPPPVRRRPAAGEPRCRATARADDGSGGLASRPPERGSPRRASSCRRPPYVGCAATRRSSRSS